MLDKYERWIHFYTASFTSIPLGAPNFQMEEVLTKIEEHFKKGLCHKLVDRDTACIRISGFKFNKEKNAAALLIQYSDSKASDPSFADLVSGNLRQEPKLSGEGIAVSAHIVIRLTHLPNRPLEFLMLLEDVPGIGKTKLIPFFNGMIKELLKRDFIDGADGKTKTCHPVLVMDHHASQTLKDDLNEGEMRFIEMSKTQTISGMDEEPFLVRGTSSIKVKVKPKLDGADAVGLINRLKVKYLNKGYDHFKITFNRDGRQRTVDLSGHREDAGEALFGKMEMIRSEDALPQCSDTLNMKMIKTIAKLN